MNDGRAPQIFISYHHALATRARELYDGLGDAGMVSFMDHRGGLAPGVRWFSELDDALARTRIHVVLVSEAALGSRWVEYEWRTTMRRHLNGEDTVLLPVLIGDITVSMLPPGLACWQALPLGAPGPEGGCVSDVVAMVRRLCVHLGV